MVSPMQVYNETKKVRKYTSQFYMRNEEDFITGLCTLLPSGFTII